MTRPHVVGTRLHRDQHQVGRQQRGARKRRDPWWPVNDHEIRLQGDLRGFLVQGVPRQPEYPVEPLLATLEPPLCPIKSGALRIGIQQRDVAALQGEFARQVRGKRGLPCPALLVE